MTGSPFTSGRHHSSGVDGTSWPLLLVGAPSISTDSAPQPGALADQRHGIYSPEPQPLLDRHKERGSPGRCDREISTTRGLKGWPAAAKGDEG
jgi:hypothetical protein